MQKIMTIKEIPSEERPYEKLEMRGASALSDAELLAIIIKCGTKEEKSTDIAMRVLNQHASGLIGLHKLSMKELQTIKGIGRVKAIQLKAITELSNRMAKATYKEKLNVHSPSSVASIYMEALRHLECEHFKVVILDTKHNIIGDHTLSVGTVNASLVHPREVFIYALRHHAVSIILLHNHPSGNSTPSNEDIAITKRIQSSGEILGINLLDHIVIGDGNYTSLKEKGYISG